MQQQEPDVTELLKEYEKLHDIADVENLPPPNFLWLWVVVSIVVILLIIFLIYFKRKRNAQEKTIIVKSPKEQALERLDVLFQSGWIDDLQVKKFTYEVNIILRKYLEGEFQLHASEQTTEEFFLSNQLENILSPEQSTRLKEFLQHCDVIKYSDVSASAAELKDLWDYTKDFVETSQSQQEVGT